MSVIALAGCRSTPLLSYLRGLGVLAILQKQYSAELMSLWQGNTLHISGNLTREAINTFFLERYTPSPILSPWNGGGGFRTLKNEKGEKAVESIATSGDPRFAPFRRAIEEGRKAWREGMASGWIEERWEKQPGKKDKYILAIEKNVFLAHCRSVFPDEALDWLDATVVLADEKKPQYPLLLGTGGNLGRLDLATNYMEALSLLLDPGNVKRSNELLGHSLFGEGHPPLDKKPVGQYAPGSAGTMNSSAFGSAESLVNLWSFVLGLEGTLLFASGVARRFNGSRGMATTPFTVPTNPVGYTSAEGETVKGEVWVPLWKRPLTVPELRRVIAEGRISWNGMHAANGLDAAKALTTLGVDRGLDRFERYVMAERFGQSPLAVPVGSYSVAAEPADRVSLLGETDRWVNRIRRQKDLPQAAVSKLRQVDAAQMNIVLNPKNPEALQGFLAQLALLEQIISRNRDVRENVGSPIPPLAWNSWGKALEDSTVEWRLAVAIATQRDRSTQRRSPNDQERGAASTFLRPVKLAENPSWKGFDWSERTPEYLRSRSVVDGLSSALVSRSMLSQGREPGDVPVVGTGSLVAFDWASPVGLADLSAFLNCQVDDERLGHLLSIVALLDGLPSLSPPPRPRDPFDVDTARAILGPFYHCRPVSIPVTEGRERDNAEGKRLFIPSLSWPQKLQAGNVKGVLREAIVRLRMAGFSPAIRPEFVRVPAPKRLQASLLIPIRTDHVQRGIRSVCPPPPKNQGEKS